MKSFEISVVGRILESDIFVKSNGYVGYKYPPDRYYGKRAVSCHQPKSVGAAARRRVLANEQGFVYYLHGWAFRLPVKS